jgi:predicted Fe-Mo cluster-binding NifX family protein
MILIISAQNPSLDSPVEGRFGRSPWLVRVDTETGQWTALQNPGPGQSGGAGVAAAQLIIDQNAHTVISGDFGPHAAGAFRAAKIEMRLFAAGVATVRQAVDHLAADRLPVFI